MFFDPSFLEKIRQIASIEEVIGKRVPLKKKGFQSYRGLCPFHNDKTPSMHVHGGKQIFKCFSCNEGGDVFSFLMKFEHLSFQEAVISLAKEYHLDTPQMQSIPKEHLDKHMDIKAINDYAKKVYHQYLMRHKEALIARKYLASRGMTKEIIEYFEIGYAPRRDGFLYPLVKDKKETILKETGLFSLYSGRWIEVMKGRILFPILNEKSETLGFGGRIIEDEENGAKYLNTRETPVFLKYNILYGLNYSYSLVRNSKEILLVEGYMDCIACIDHGFASVAPLGTSITENQLRKIKRVSDRAYFVFDGDDAGRRASLRAAELSLQVEMSAYIVLLRDGEDPYDFLQKEGKEVFKAYIEQNKKESFDFILEQKSKSWKEADVYRRQDILKEVGTIIRKISSPLMQEELLKKSAFFFQVREDIFFNTLGIYQRNIEKKKTSDSPIIQLEKKLIIFLLTNTEYLKDIHSLMEVGEIQSPIVKDIYKKILKLYLEDRLDYHQFMSSLEKPLRDNLEKKIIILEEELENTDKRKYFIGLSCRLKENYIKEKIRNYKEKLKIEIDPKISIEYREKIMTLVKEKNHLLNYIIKN